MTPPVRNLALAGLVGLAALGLPVTAHTATGTGPDPLPPTRSAAPTNTTTLAFQQKSIQINRRRIGHQWRCSTKTGNTVYFATGFTEGEARRALEAYVGHRVSCFREDEFFF